MWRDFVYIFYVHVCPHVYMDMSTGAQRGQKRVLDALELEL